MAVAQLVTSLGLPIPRVVSPGPRAHASCAGKMCGCPATAKALGNCCCTKPTGSPGHRPSAVPASTCQAVKAKTCCSTHAKPKESPVETPWVIAWQAAQCRGHGSAGDLLLPPPAVAPPDPGTVSIDVPDRGAAPSPTVRFPQLTTIPPTPPPKIG